MRSPRPEFTPPILYNRDNRSKLVFMVEAAIDPAAARELHPGQPVDVTLLAAADRVAGAIAHAMAGGKPAKVTKLDERRKAARAAS